MSEEKALIVIDVQNDFMPGGALAVPEGDQVVPVINQMIDAFDLVVATQDWHPQNHMSFASNHPGKHPFEEIELHGMRQTLWPDHCVQGSKGAEFHPDLNTQPFEAIFRKGMDASIDSYSGFYDNGHLKATGLAGFLKERGVKSLYFCGLAGDYCVYYSILDALKEGFDCWCVEGAVRAIHVDKYQTIKSELKASSVQWIDSVTQ